MKKIENWNEVSETSGFKDLKVGAFVCKILKVEDLSDKEYIKVTFDIVEGELKSYFQEASDRLGKWLYAGQEIRSYKTNALPFFKAFITAIEKSNDGYKWNWNEQSLVGKLIVGVFGEEEYQALNGDIETSIRVQEWRSLVALREGKIKLPTLKKLKGTVAVKDNTTADNDAFYETTIKVDSSDLPF